ncbi:hypothetical protein AAG570_013340 [Ranatra chinensis]|uniref:Uncharacterized protein n=1 Tax=Ranatra chinensis TaxID=642074 RepID=A0ABD0YUZ4_9HEMI
MCSKSSIISPPIAVTPATVVASQSHGVTAPSHPEVRAAPAWTRVCVDPVSTSTFALHPAHWMIGSPFLPLLWWVAPPLRLALSLHAPYAKAGAFADDGVFRRAATAAYDLLLCLFAARGTGA